MKTIPIGKLSASDADAFERSFGRGGGCWEWSGQMHPEGYGYFRVGGSTLLAHRVSFRYFNGHDPGSMYVCHACDNRRCVNPQHLFLGTHEDNMRDAANKGRMSTPGAQMEQNGRSKLTCQDVVSCRDRYRSGESAESLAREHGVANVTMRMALRGETWAKVPGAVRVWRGRARGQHAGGAILTPEKVVQMRKLRAQGHTLKSIADRFGVRRGNVGLVVRGVSWRHVGGPISPPGRAVRRGLEES